jgi:general secretion pathway protein G
MTLIEVLIVIAILVAIGGLLVVNLMPRKEAADIDLQRADFKTIDNALRLFKLDIGRYPTEEEGLAALQSKDALENEDDAVRWKAAYLELATFKDKWNHDIVYRNPSEEFGEGQYDLVSFGPDGEEGTDDDITNHDGMTNADTGSGESDSAPLADDGFGG